METIYANFYDFLAIKKNHKSEFKKALVLEAKQNNISFFLDIFEELENKVKIQLIVPFLDENEREIAENFINIHLINFERENIEFIKQNEYEKLFPQIIEKDDVYFLKTEEKKIKLHSDFLETKKIIEKFFNYEKSDLKEPEKMEKDILPGFSLNNENILAETGKKAFDENNNEILLNIKENKNIPQILKSSKIKNENNNNDNNNDNFYDNNYDNNKLENESNFIKKDKWIKKTDFNIKPLFLVKRLKNLFLFSKIKNEKSKIIKKRPFPEKTNLNKSFKNNNSSILIPYLGLLFLLGFLSIFIFVMMKFI